MHSRVPDNIVFSVTLDPVVLFQIPTLQAN